MAGSPWIDAMNRGTPGYKPEFGPGAWSWWDAAGKPAGPGSRTVQEGMLDKLLGTMGNLFGNSGAGAAGGAGTGGFSFQDGSGNPIGGVFPGAANTSLNVPAVWNPDIAAGSRGDLLGAAGKAQAVSSPYARGGPPTMADARPGMVDANRAAALSSQNQLNLSGLAGQAGSNLAQQQALASQMQGAQGLGNSMYGYGANEQLLGGDLANRQAQTGLAALMKLFGLANNLGADASDGGGRGIMDLFGIPKTQGSQNPHLFGQNGIQAMQPMMPMW